MLDASQIWSSLPAVIKEYDSSQERATVRVLVKMRYKDGSQTDFPLIHNVRVVTPGTAFSGFRLPIRVGDKVVLDIQDRDIQRLLATVDTSGLSDPGNTRSDYARMHDLTDAVAYTGFGTFKSAKGTDFDLWIFNNDDGDSYNHVRLKQNGDIEIKTLDSNIVATKSGTISLSNSQASVDIGEDGKVDIVAPLEVSIDTPNLNVSGNINSGANIVAAVDVRANGGTVGLLTHKHSPTGSPPVNPS